MSSAPNSAQPTAREQMRSVKERLRAEAVEYVAKAKKPKDVCLFTLSRLFGVGFRDGEMMITRERLARGEISLADLTPPQRRALIDPSKLDLHALAVGPIMDSNEIYLPAGKISLAAAKAREAATILPCDSGSDPKGEDPSGAECGASQSGGDSRIAHPSPDLSPQSY